MFMTLGCSVAKEHAVLKIKYNEDHSTNLIKTSPADKIYDIESYHVYNLIFKKPFAPDSNVVYIFVELHSYMYTCNIIKR